MSLAIGLTTIAPAGAKSGHECVDTLPAGTYVDVNVTQGQSCVFDEGVTIEGNFNAENPVNIVTSGATVHGNVTIDGATGDVAIISGETVGSTAHIYGNVTIKNSDQSETIPDESGVIVITGLSVFSDEGDLAVISTLHIHGNLSMRDNNVFDFFAGTLFAHQIVDGNVLVEGNVLADLDLHVYAMDIGGNLTVRGNNAQVFTSVLCNDVEGNLTIRDNVNPGVDPGFGPAPGVIWAELQVATNCADLIHPDIPSGNGTVDGNMTIRNNTVGDGNNNFARISIFASTVLGDVDVSRNEVNAHELSEDSVIAIGSSTVGEKLTCKNNNLEPIDGGYLGPNVSVGDDRCFGDE